MAISIEHMKTLLETVQTDVEKFNNGNMSAGTRVRKAMQEIKAHAQELRLNVQEIKNNK
tara:strand:- start:36 stop:212 length:177 start_codon:yes stop_codon:yes gene_type:complete